jgi:gamma-D-glutamyl-L-lysine dipeptidyl-peptidase
MEITDYGICRLALIPVRKKHGDAGEQITQLLFGDSYECFELTTDKKWMRIKVSGDGCEGWIDVRQHHSITPEYFEQVGQVDFKITTDIASGILYKKSPLTILMGSIVPIAASELFKMEEQLAFNGESKSMAQKRDGEFVRSIALKYINAPYQWGGKSPFGIDAPGLTQMVFKISGYAIPREVAKQATVGKKVKSVGEATPGDLAFFESKEGIVHVGLVLPEDKIIHAYGHVRIDHLNEEGILNAETKIYSHHLSTIRRVLPG